MIASESTILQDQIVVVGECLVDCFPDGDVIGGAPLNVAWNLQGFGLRPRFVSAVGQDDLGRKITAALAGWGLDTRGVVVRRDLPTGRVLVTLRDGHPSYEIQHPVAYDALPSPADSGWRLTDVADDPESSRWLYLGSLAWRDRSSHDALDRWMSLRGYKRFVDINLRAPWYQTDLLHRLMRDAAILKLNDDELSTLTGGSAVDTPSSILAAARKLLHSTGGGRILVTCGAQGVHAIDHDRHDFAPAAAVPRLRDTVGAGDAFSSAFLATVMRGGSVPQGLRSGVVFASRVCGIAGATTTDRGLYANEALHE